MKEENVKIVQICIEPRIWYESNGGMYKTKHETQLILGLGDDAKIYNYGKHTFYAKEKGYTNHDGWREYWPE